MSLEQGKNTETEKIVQKIKECGENVLVPDSLQPDRMETILSDAAGRKHEKISSRRITPKRIAAVAAAACLACIVGFGTWMGSGSGDKGTRVAMNGEDKRKYKSYEEIYDALSDEAKRASNSTGEGIFDITESEDAMTAKSSLADSGVASGAMENESVDMSTTNIQVEGVDEGDIVKSDGKYFYVSRVNEGDRIDIVERGKEGLLDIQKIYVTMDRVAEMYLSDGKLTVIGEDEDTTAVEIFDISNPSKPEKKTSFHQSGHYQTSRYVDGHLYLFSYMYLYNILDIKKEEVEKYVPSVGGKTVDCGNICPPEEKEVGEGYFVMSGYDVANQVKEVQNKAILIDYPLIYASRNYLYLVERNEHDTSTIIRYSYEKGTFKDRTVAKVDGYLNDRFSMDEKDGYLRVVTTSQRDYLFSGTTENGLYILDENMKQTGSVTGLAKGERIYSARFMGDMGYFVTYRETDPLFSVDLSNPKKPKVLGALKIPGFSNYLQFYNENLLFGIGQENGRVKISMFDITNPADVKEVDKKILGYYEWSEAWNEPHSVLIDEKKNIVAFPVSRYDSYDYLVYSYEEGEGFVKRYKQQVKAKYDYDMEYSTGPATYRGIYIDNSLYVVESCTGITEVSLEDFQEKEYFRFS